MTLLTQAVWWLWNVLWYWRCTACTHARRQILDVRAARGPRVPQMAPQLWVRCRDGDTVLKKMLRPASPSAPPR
jgi:hypothetical protein